MKLATPVIPAEAGIHGRRAMQPLAGRNHGFPQSRE
jgi:hypothetical protein